MSFFLIRVTQLCPPSLVCKFNILLFIYLFIFIKMSKIKYNIEKLISEGSIEYYEYSDFKNIQPIGKGSSGSVSRATWKNTTRFFALKSFNNDKQTHKEIIKEV
jgi:hypothetical protein